ncbi:MULTISPECIES: exodeoxyribonuclease I [unclassified Modicisalibacter]|uniref:exodeoxyribonuclease I n=1 Tax=unclassified Modicisalibacter TaxID=2679913 RepID=UPI001CCBA42A|nr:MULTISPECIES: exodeoxyribonuclease I [unclassified Modicisalibacter]MBZ9558219.1 exodeoxyribonuclease I [Modicisalibacter sp. R2A 31.J]MBZ9573113.1 exodeoxyribonuclease I [Modicisalibacter sp. MOD 31.J]
MARGGDSQQTFLWHDYETFGADPRNDRPSQFAAIRTDADFNEIGEPLTLYCRPADDYLPWPQACLITGITPQTASRRGLPEREFAARINALMSQPGTCALGYNSLRFDDEVSRHLFYRNLLDPYAREWQNGNSRWDLIDVVRAFHALRPEGIEWPRRDDGSPSFRLEDLTAANGIEHAGAHDALADVRATIALARLLRERNPRLFDYLLSLRSKRAVGKLLDIPSHKPMLHISRRYPASRGCSALVVPLAEHPGNPNGVIVYDLSVDPAPLFELDAGAIRQRVFASADELSEGEARIPLKIVHVNRSPVLLPVSALSDTVAARVGIDRAACERHWQALIANPEAARKAAAVFADGPPSTPSDPDLMLYSGGFFSPADRQQMQRVHETSPEALGETAFAFQDPRLEEMLFRMRARSYPDTLSGEEQQQWEAYRWARLNDASLGTLTLQGFAREIERLNQVSLDDRERQILEELVMYVEGMLPPQAFG